MIYTFTKDMNLDKFNKEVRNLFPLKYEYFVSENSTTELHFSSELTAQELIDLELLIENHILIDIRRIRENRLKEIAVICNEIVINYQLDMIELGINAEKSGEVAMFLHKTLHYIAVQAIDEACNEINNLVTLGIPSTLNPFITESNIIIFRDALANGII